MGQQLRVRLKQLRLKRRVKRLKARARKAAPAKAVAQAEPKASS